MTPLQVSTFIIRPGAMLGAEAEHNQTSKDPQEFTVAPDPWGDLWGMIADAQALYSVERQKVLKNEGDVLVDEIGRLKETIFGVSALQEFGDICSPPQHWWMVEFMSEGGYEDVRQHIAGLWQIAASKIARDKTGEPLKDTVLEIYFMTMWDVSTSQDWETGTTDIDSIDLIGEADIVLKPEPETPTEGHKNGPA